MITASVVNQKGGVCKTTLCRNLGDILATRYGKKVLLVDLDSSGNLSYFFGLNTGKSEKCGAAQVIWDINLDPNEHIVSTRLDNLFLLPGGEYLGDVEMNILADTSKPQQVRLRHQLKKVQNQFDYCLIDCPPTVARSVIVYNALTASDHVIIPCTATYDSIRGIGKIIEMTNDTNEWWNDKVTIRGVVYCRVGRKNLDRELLKQKLPVPRFRTYIHECSALAEYSRANNITFREHSPSASGTHDMENLAAELIGQAFPYPEELPDELDDFIA